MTGRLPAGIFLSSLVVSFCTSACGQNENDGPRFREPMWVLDTHALFKVDPGSRLPIDVAWSPDGSTLAVAIPNHSWGSRVGGVTRSVVAAARRSISPSDVIAGSSDPTNAYILLIDVATVKFTGCLASEALGRRSPRAQFSNLQFSPSGRTLACLYDDGEFVLWDLKSRSPRLTHPHNDNHRWIAGAGFDFLPDGRSVIVVGDGRAQIRDLSRNRLIKTFEGRFGPNVSVIHRRFLSGLKLFDLATGKEILRVQDQPWDVESQWVDPQGAVGCDHRRSRIGWWDFDSGKLVFPFVVHGAQDRVRIHDFGVGPDGRLLAIGCADGRIRICEIPSGRLVAQLRRHRAAVDALAFSPRGTAIASASRDGTTVLWNVADLVADAR